MDKQSDTSTDERLEAEREIIRQSLDEIATEVGTALRDAGMNCPIYLAVPNSGDAITTIATPIDPPDEDWSHISAVVCQIIGKRLGGIRLRGRDLRCAMTNAAMVAADVMVD